MKRALAGNLLLFVLAAGCTAPRGPIVVTDPDPSIKVLAIERAVGSRDMSVTPQLVADLNNDDPAIRMYAIGGLQRLTGQTFGYRYFDDEDQRKPALKKWQQWLSEQQPTQSAGARP